MSITTSITTLPRNIVKASLQAARLPLTIVERLTNHADAEAWPPAIAFEAFEAETKKVVGSLLRDDEFVREGQLQRAKIRQLAEAERLMVEAGQKREAADAELQQRRQVAEQDRQRVERQSEEHKQRIEHDKVEKERKVREEALQREQAAAKSAKVREKAVTAQERQAERTRIAEEAAALSKRSHALSATRKAQSVDDRLEQTKAQRKGA